MARALKIKKLDAGPNVNYDWLSAYRLRVEIEQAVDMDARVFLYRRDPINPHTGEVRDTFFTVCSPVDMEDYPPEDPDPAKQYPFFRRDWIELDFRATSQADEAYAMIVLELNALIFALNRLESLDTVEEFWVGDAPPDDPGNSSESMEA
jgi:hypothetical protein